MWTRIFRLLLFVCLASTKNLYADVTGSILGVVKDRPEAAVVGAKVVATNVDTNLTQEAVSADDGSFRILALPEALSLDPKYTDARVQLGLVLSQKGDLPGAASVFCELVRREPSFAEAHNSLGLVLLQMGEVTAARAEFNEVIRLKPRYAEAHFNLALALKQQGKEVESRAEFDQAYEISPELRNASRP